MAVEGLSRRDVVVAESRVGVVASWAALSASFALSFATWVALARLAEFDGRVVVRGVSVSLAWAMPLCVDGYLVSALVAWMSPVSPGVARFARRNTYGAAAVGVVAQSAYHATVTWQRDTNAWLSVLAAGVGLVPPLFAALAVHLRALVRRAALDRVAATAPATAATRDSDVVTQAEEILRATVAEPAPRLVSLPAAATGAAKDWDRDAATRLLRQGRTPAEVAPVVGVSRRTIERLSRSLQPQPRTA